MSKHRVSRRQFLSYTLTGVGGFMAASIMMPMVRFAVDPVLKATGESDYIPTEAKVEDIGTEPTRVDFSYNQKDAWYESQVTETAWVYKQENGELLAMSPICKHLGCIVDWNSNEEYPNQFFCPCHAGRYYKNGVNVPGTPPTAPLDVYDYKIVDGFLHFGAPQPRERV
ncbi:QcrA and Rieske domain-containing protein [Bacillus fonticola]|uniref:QcrA and Rieske domain-containing protein n=1 Tax=Bacillus fonticola TaxID=2728853 RepID=UPI001474EB6C|nr:ubiquinol-cytochrome c reductase iron-sulfur subunit [Bacillus fonticola]